MGVAKRLSLLIPHVILNRGPKVFRGTIAIGLAVIFWLSAFHFWPAPPVQAVSLGFVISQVYGGAGCGTAGCSTYQNDFIEIFNRSNSAVTCTGCSVQYAAATGTAWQVTALPATLTLQPGQYYLVAESFGANGVNPLPTPDTTGTIAMSATAAKVALVNSTTALSGACPTLNGSGSPAVLDFVGYGATANCFEGAGTAPAPSTTTSDIRNGGGSVDTDNNNLNFQALAPTPRNTASPAGGPAASGGVVSGRIVDEAGAAVAGAVVNLSGSQSRKTITDANGNYRFNKIETTGLYAVTPTRANYTMSPGERSFSQLGNQTEAIFTAAFSGDIENPLDTAEYFVRQQYLDVLRREPDEAGFNYWSNQINACGGDTECTRSRRIGVAAAFFIEQEAQQAGSFICNLYEGALGRKPAFGEYEIDRQQVIGGANLEARKAAFAQSFAQRSEFADKYQVNSTGESFVDALLANLRQSSGVDLTSERDSLVGRYNTGANRTQGRSLVLREITEASVVRDANYNKSFVLTEYFSYLGRNPDTGGYNFWLNVLNARDQSNYRDMVCSFINSTEYQRRFSTLVTHSSAECEQ
ncbi:MAG: hypothetical protein JWM21_899 [Acidobacteria bacterium]|nr:hypothetical protein [Acidobacteriota bacterium]